MQSIFPQISDFIPDRLGQQQRSEPGIMLPEEAGLALCFFQKVILSFHKV